LKINEKLHQAQKTIEDELKQVGEIQASLLPPSLPVIDGYEFGALYILQNTPEETITIVSR